MCTFGELFEWWPDDAALSEHSELADANVRQIASDGHVGHERRASVEHDVLRSTEDAASAHTVARCRLYVLCSVVTLLWQLHHSHYRSVSVGIGIRESLAVSLSVTQ